MQISKITNTNFGNKPKTNIAKNLLYSASAAVAILACAQKSNAQTITDMYGQTYVHYNQYQQKAREVANYKYKRDLSESEKNQAWDEGHAARQEIRTLRNNIERTQRKYAEEIKYRDNYDENMQNIAETLTDILNDAQDMYMRSVKDYDETVKKSKTSPWKGFGIGGLLGYIGACIFIRYGKKHKF